MSLDELEASLQQIRNEMSQDIIQILYASMPDRVASCHKTVLSRYLSPIEYIWDHLRRRVRHSMSLNELEASLQQIRNQMSQDIIQILYASMPDRVASGIRTRVGSKGY
ncbi:hypothetical protein TNCV_3275731 [Trichonephila clavipes]|nr:hypothetical protein TNCV_3275731 [Trichonephila clavipes]